MNEHMERTNETRTQSPDAKSRITIKLIDGTRIVKDFPSRSNAVMEMGHLNLFARLKEGSPMTINFFEGNIQVNPNSVVYIRSEHTRLSDSFEDWTIIDGNHREARIQGPGRSQKNRTVVAPNLAVIGPTLIRYH